MRVNHHATGFKDIAEETLLEGGQGDSFIGLMSYTDVARTIIAASKSPDATYKTFEARRRTTQEAVGKKMEPADFQKLFLKLVVGEVDSPFAEYETHILAYFNPRFAHFLIV